MHWFRRRKLADDLKAVAEIAGDQIAPGAGTWLLVLGGLAAGAVATYATYAVTKNRKKKKAAKGG